MVLAVVDCDNDDVAAADMAADEYEWEGEESEKAAEGVLVLMSCK